MNAPSSAEDRGESLRGGATLTNVVATLTLLLIFFLLFTPSCGSARETGRQNGCRENLRNLFIATKEYQDRHGRLPGFANPREETPFVADDGITPIDVGPVSWVAVLLETLDRVPSDDAISRSKDAARPTATPTPMATPTASAPPEVPEQRLGPSRGYRAGLVCPSIEEKGRGPRLSYAANTGMPDARQSVPATDGREGIPRDWRANGVFFDRYGDAKSTRGDERKLGPTVTMAMAMIRDPRDKTILFAENLNAGPYVAATSDFPGGDPMRGEILWGLVWGAGPIDVATSRSVGVATSWNAPTMKPPPELLAPDVERNHAGSAKSYRHSRPSSLHPQGSTFGFAGGNVVFVRDTLSYFIFAKLMASDDADVKLPGTLEPLDERLRTYQLTDVDLNP